MKQIQQGVIQHENKNIYNLGDYFDCSYFDILLGWFKMKPNYWEKNKRGLLPKIKDWTGPHNEIRHSNNVKAMTYNEWLYLHPSAYQLIYYGMDCVGMVIFTLVAVYLYRIGASFGALILLVFVIAFIYDLIRKIKNKEQIKDLTLYDMFMREL